MFDCEEFMREKQDFSVENGKTFLFLETDEHKLYVSRKLYFLGAFPAIKYVSDGC